jgi:pSer/pThr/pTyr-binding forkhead associated (FHA) protein
MKPAAPGRTGTQIFGALAPGRAKLVLEGGDAFEGATFRLNADRVEAGRTKGAILFPDDPCLAPHHATFFYRGGTLHVRDEGAPGGVSLRLRGLSIPLRAGDHFAVGERLLRFAGLLPPAPPPPPDGTRRLGAPRPAPPVVVVEEWLEGGAGGRVFVRSGPAVTIGRAGCAVNLGDDPHLSQSHAEIVVEQDGSARLRDLGSSNGTYVKVPPHAERELRDGDHVRMGHEVLRVSVAGE